MLNTHISAQVRCLHGALTEIVGVMNRPQRDEMMLREAGIALDRALFPLLVGIERRGPIGVVDLADQVGRDYTTVSRQVAKLESLGLVQRTAGVADRRVREAVVTPRGRVMTDAVDAARERIAQATFAAWEANEVDDLIRLVHKFADALKVDSSAERATIPAGDGNELGVSTGGEASRKAPPRPAVSRAANALGAPINDA